MKIALAVVGVIALVGLGVLIYNKKIKTKGCGCGCGGNCSDDKHNHKEDIVLNDTSMPQVAVLAVDMQHNCEDSGLGDGWITNYDAQQKVQDIFHNQR